MTDIDAQGGEADTPAEIAPETLFDTLLTRSHEQLVLHPELTMKNILKFLNIDGAF